MFPVRTRVANELEASAEIEEVNRILSEDISRYLERRGSANKHRTTEARAVLMDDSSDRWTARCARYNNIACLLFEKCTHRT